MKARFSSKKSVLATAIAVGLFGSVPVQAQTWTNTTADALWSTAGNWSTAAEPTAATDVILPTPIPSGGGTITLSAGELANSLTINDAYTLNGGNLALTGGGINVASTFTGTINSVLNGTAGLAKTGAGTLVLSGANDYSGVTNVAGILNLQNASALGETGAGNGTTVPSGAALQIQGGISVGNEPLTLSGGGVASPANLGALRNISGDNTWGGPVTIGATTRINSDSGTLTLNNANSVSSTNVALVLGGAGNTTISGSVALGTGGVSKDGAGTVVISGNGTWGATTVSTGTLTVSGNSTATGGISVGNVSAMTATLNQSAGNFTLSGNQLLLGGGGSISIYNLSGGTLAGAASTSRGIMLGTNTGGNSTFNLSGTGVINMPGSILQVGRSDSVAATTTNVYNQTGGTATFGNLSIGGAGTSINLNSTVNWTGGTFTASGAFTVLAASDGSTASLTIGGTADVTLPAFPTARGAGSTATLTFDGGTLKPLAASATYMSGLTNAFITDLGAKFDVASGRDITVAQAFQNAAGKIGTLTKLGVGQLALSGANSYTGSTTITAGSILSETPGALFNTSSVAVNNAGSTLAVRYGGAADYNAADVAALLSKTTFAANTTNFAFNTTNAVGSTATYGAVLSMPAGLIKLGTGTLVLTQANTYTGSTTNNGGTLQLGDGTTGNDGTIVSASVINNGTLAFNRFGSDTYAGIISGAGAVIKSGPGSQTLSGNNTYTGTTTIQNGSLTLSGNRTVAGGAIVLGDAATNATTVLNIQGDLVFAGTNHFIGRGPGASGTVNQTAGNMTINGGTNFFLGSSGASGNITTAVYNLSGGSLGSATQVVNVSLGVNSFSNSTFNLSGTGVLDLTAGALEIGRNRTNPDVGDSSATFNQSGGTATVGTLYLGGTGTSPNSIGMMNLTGGTFSATNFSSFAVRPTSTSSLKIGGTADVTLPAFPTARGAGSTATLTFDGGTLKPLAASATYMSGLTNAFVTALGAKLDVGTGKDITIAQTLENAPTQAGTLTKLGEGKLTLTGVNTFSGNTTVSAGTLALDTTGSIAASPVINVAALATFDVSTVTGGFVLGTAQTLAGNGSVAGNVTLAAGANLSPGASPGTLTFTGNLDLSATGGSNSGDLFFELSTSSDLVNLTTGTLSIGSSLGFNDFAFTSGLGFGPGIYTLFNSSAPITGTLDGANLTGLIGAGFSGTLGLADGGNDVVLNVTAIPEPSTLVLAGLGALGFAGLRLRRRRVGS